MGFFSRLLGNAPAFVAPSLLTWYSPQDALTTLVVPDLADAFPSAKEGVLDRDAALRIPAVKRAHDIVCGVLADMPWVQHDGDTPLAQQPEWLVTTKTGIAPRDLRWGVVSDLFMSGWALIGFEVGDDGQPADALHIPRGWWDMDKATGEIQVSVKIDARYRQRVVPIRLGYGSNGMLIDAVNDLRDAATIREAYRDRIDNPIALTMLTVAGDRWDGWEPDERKVFLEGFKTARSAKGGATGMKPDWVTVDTAGQLPTDLFESGRNANRLDIANHAGLPANLLEGSKQGGGTDIKYSGVQDGATRNELWDYGLSKYASAIAGRLSLDDVCAPGQSIRVDTSRYLTSPNPPQQQTSQD